MTDQQTDRSDRPFDHEPVMLDEVTEDVPVRCRRASCWTRRSVAAVTARPSSTPVPTSPMLGLDRDPAALSSGERAPGALR